MLNNTTQTLFRQLVPVDFSDKQQSLKKFKNRSYLCVNVSCGYSTVIIMHVKFVFK